MMLGDTDRSNFSRDEALKGNLDGVNRIFTPLHWLISPRGFQIRIGNTILTPATDYEVDAQAGIVTFTSAPTYANKMPVATYHWMWCTDEDYHGFTDDGCSRCGYAGTGDSDAARAEDALTKLPDPLVDAVQHYVGHHFNMKRANEWAVRFSSTGGGVGAQVDVVTKNFLTLAKQFGDDGDKYRDDYYKRHGAREAPAAAISRLRGINTSYTPRR